LLRLGIEDLVFDLKGFRAENVKLDSNK